MWCKLISCRTYIHSKNHSFVVHSVTFLYRQHFDCLKCIFSVVQETILQYNWLFCKTSECFVKQKTFLHHKLLFRVMYHCFSAQIGVLTCLFQIQNWFFVVWGSQPTPDMKVPDHSLTSLIISNQIPWFLNNTLKQLVLKIRLKTRNVKQNLLIS